jgi:uncharacterized repeat protein (TIGR02543 family)
VRLHPFVLAALTTTASIVLVPLAPAPAHATGSGGVALYLSAPLVQGSEIDSAGTLTEDFNGLGGSPSSGGAVCPTSLEIGTLSVAPSTAACLYRTPGIYGGAAATTSSPSFGGDGSTYFGTYSSSNAELTFTFPAGGVKYVGFWWSGGNRGNVVTFYNGATEVATLDTLALEQLLGNAPPSSWPSGNGSLTSMGGTSYPKGHYFGNPRGFTANPPLSQSAGLAQEGVTYTEHRGFIFAYINLFLTGDQTATSVKFSGNGFEFDNLTTSTLEQTPATSLVFVKGLVGKTVQFLPGANDATGSMVAQSSTTAANLSANGYQRSGFTFTGWNTAEDGTGTPYAAGANFDFVADLTLYAQWELASISGKTVQFFPGANDVTGSMVAQSSTTAANLSANGYQRAGFTFTGWNTAEDGTGTPYAAGANFDFATDLTLYAQWELESNSGGGGSPEDPGPTRLAVTGVDYSLALFAAVGSLCLGVVAITTSTVLARRRSRSV